MDIRKGFLGNGTVFWDRDKEVNGDYQTIAHIDASGFIKYRIPVAEIPYSVIKQIEKEREYTLAAIAYCKWLENEFPGYYCHDIGKKPFVYIYVLHPKDASNPKLWSVVDMNKPQTLYRGDSYDEALKIFNDFNNH